MERKLSRGDAGKIDPEIPANLGDVSVRGWYSISEMLGGASSHRPQVSASNSLLIRELTGKSYFLDRARAQMLSCNPQYYWS
jgi:hypothetical protein